MNLGIVLSVLNWLAKKLVTAPPGNDLLEQALFAPVEFGVFDAVELHRLAQTPLTQICLVCNGYSNDDYLNQLF